MWYSDKIIIQDEGTELEIKEATATVEFSMGDLRIWKESLEASLKTDLDHSSKEWVKLTIEDINSSLKKL
ncbi:hypothetical protein ACIVBQ_000565 [Tenacibaculum discolor]